VRLVDGFIARKNDDLALVQWVAAQAPPDAQLLSFGPTLAFRHYTSLPTFDLFDLTPADLSAVLATSAPTLVLIDETNVEEQWLGQSPSINVLRLQAEPGLTPLGENGAYTLFRVNST
jgi:hypothetical protein